MKVILPRNVAQALEYLRNESEWKDEDLINTLEFLNHSHEAIKTSGFQSIIAKWLSEDYKRLVPWTKAVLYGYEVDNPHKRIKEIYDKSVISYGDIGCQLDDYTTKILTKEILNILEIKIEGIND